MKLSDAFPSRYLKADDLDDHDWTVTIKSVALEQMGVGADQQVKLVVAFDELDKALICNKTNASTIAKLYGDDTDTWIGKAIVLWPNHDVEFKGEIVSAVRVRSRKPQGNGTQRTRTVWSFAQAIQAATGAGISEADLKTRLHELGITSYRATEHTSVVEEIIRQHRGAAAPTGEDSDSIPF